MSEPVPVVVGRGRSGTTLLRAMLNAHPQLAMAGESPWFGMMFQMPSRFEPGGRIDLDLFIRVLTSRITATGQWDIDIEHLERHLIEEAPETLQEAVRASRRIYAAFHAKPRYGEKTPTDLTRLEIMAALFPENRYVHIIRDPRNVVLSAKASNIGPQRYPESAYGWNRVLERGRRAGRSLGPRRYLEVLYEDLVTDTRAQLERVCSLVELDFDPAMLQYHQKSGAWAGTSHRLLASPPVAATRDWRQDMRARDERYFSVLCGEQLRELGYETTVEPRGPRYTLIAASMRARMFVDFKLRGVVARLRWAVYRARGKEVVHPKHWRKEDPPLALDEEVPRPPRARAGT